MRIMLTVILRTLLVLLERQGGLWLLLLGLCHLAQSASGESSFLSAPPPPARVARRGYSSLTFGSDRARPRCLHLISNAFTLVDSKGYQCDPMHVSAIRRDARHRTRLADGSEERAPEEKKSLLTKVGALYSRGCCPQISLDSDHRQQSGRLTVSVNATSCRDEAARGGSNADNGRRGFCFDSLHKCVACCLRSDSQPQQSIGGGGGGGVSSIHEEDEWLGFHHCVVGCRHSAADAIDQNTFRTLTHHCFENID